MNNTASALPLPLPVDYPWPDVFLLTMASVWIIFIAVSVNHYRRQRKGVTPTAI